jgi:hypothetical protein
MQPPGRSPQLWLNETFTLKWSTTLPESPAACTVSSSAKCAAPVAGSAQLWIVPSS